MRIPRNIGASDLIRALRMLSYERVRQDGSPIRLTTTHGGTDMLEPFIRNSSHTIGADVTPGAKKALFAR